MSTAPLPWVASGETFLVRTDAPIENLIAMFAKRDDRDLALRAVNAHDALVAALEGLLGAVEHEDVTEGDCKRARAALARAKGEQAS